LISPWISCTSLDTSCATADKNCAVWHPSLEHSHYLQPLTTSSWA
jgi:hypothetical protein